LIPIIRRKSKKIRGEINVNKKERKNLLKEYGDENSEKLSVEININRK